jgi:hypothetical protein
VSVIRNSVLFLPSIVVFAHPILGPKILKASRARRFESLHVLLLFSTSPKVVKYYSY